MRMQLSEGQKKGLKIVGGVALVVIIILIVCAALGVFNDKGPTYAFTAGKDSSGGDIQHVSGSLDELKKWCTEEPECKGFNSSGWMKKSVQPETAWSTWTTDPAKGFYRKMVNGEPA